MNAGAAKRSRTPTKLLGSPTQRVSCATVPSLLAAPVTPNFPVPKSHSGNAEPDSDWVWPPPAGAKTQVVYWFALRNLLAPAYFPL